MIFSISSVHLFPNHKTTTCWQCDKKMGMWFFRIAAISHLSHHNLLHLFIHPPPVIINSHLLSQFSIQTYFFKNRLTTKLGESLQVILMISEDLVLKLILNNSSYPKFPKMWLSNSINLLKCIRRRQRNCNAIWT